MKSQPFFILISIISLFTLSCDKESSEEDINSNIEFTFPYQMSNPDNETISTNFGSWLFRDQRLEIDAIANWLNTPLDGKILLEPINVIWIDFRSNNKDEAFSNVEKFLNENGFTERGGSSGGYDGYLSTTWYLQKGKTWSDISNYKYENNHGRIFSSHEIKSNKNNSVFISSGAFSHEGDLEYIPKIIHPYISFNDARDSLNEVGDWILIDESLQVNNRINDNNYTTHDHNGVRVFALFEQMFTQGANYYYGHDVLCGDCTSNYHHGIFLFSPEINVNWATSEMSGIGSLIYLEIINTSPFITNGNYEIDLFSNRNTIHHCDCGCDINDDEIINEDDCFYSIGENDAIIDIDNSFFGFNVDASDFENLEIGVDLFEISSGDIQITKTGDNTYSLAFNFLGSNAVPIQGSINIELEYIDYSNNQ